MKWDSNAPMAEAFRARVKEMDDGYRYLPGGIETRIAHLTEAIELLMWVVHRLLNERDAKLKEQSNES